jgi:hypothetical protein
MQVSFSKDKDMARCALTGGYADSYFNRCRASRAFGGRISTGGFCADQNRLIEPVVEAAHAYETCAPHQLQ